MAPLSVDPDILADAASQYSNANTISSGAVAELAEQLDRNWGCAGTDNAGESWGRQLRFRSIRRSHRGDRHRECVRQAP